MSVPGGPPYAQQPMQQMQQPPGGMPPRQAGPADPARAASIMLLAAAGLMFIGLISKSWLTASAGGRDISIAIGPLGAEMCRGGDCIGAPTGKLPGDIELFMYLALISGFAAVAGAAVIGGMTMSGKRNIPLPPKIAQGLFGLASASMIIFIVRMFSEQGDMSPGWAMFPAIGGAVLASIGMKKLSPFVTGSLPTAQAYGQAGAQPMQYGGQPYGAQQSQPMQPYGAQQSQPMQPYGAQQSQPMQPYGAQQSQPMQPQQPQQAAPSCPRCGTPLQFVQQYQRWFCSREQQYI
jgi:hypothetical protein